MPPFREIEHWLLLVWLLIAGFTAFGVIVCWNEGLLALLYDNDRSRICLVIGLLYLIGSAHCARRAGMLARETSLVQACAARVGERTATVRAGAAGIIVDDRPVPRASILGEHLEALLRHNDVDATQPLEGEQSTQVGILVARAKGSHDLGWFLVDVLLKLGLLGTIVGFILMLGSVADTASLDVNTMQKVLKQMSNGMGTALYTTMAGLVGSLSLGMQYLLLDKGADDLIERILRLTDSRLAPG